MNNLNPILTEAREAVKTMSPITIPALERKLRTDYTTASRVLECLMVEGVIISSSAPPYQINTPFYYPT